MAVKDEETFIQWLTKFGADKFLLGADVKDEKITILGWTEQQTYGFMILFKSILKKELNKYFVQMLQKMGLWKVLQQNCIRILLKNFRAAFYCKWWC